MTHSLYHLAYLLFAFVPCEVHQKCSSYKSWAWNLTLSTNRYNCLLDSYPLCVFMLLHQFKLLPELFQDEEKVLSPTSAAPSGRVPLTRMPVKPAKARPGQASKEHKKTVGHQVSLRMQLCYKMYPFTSCLVCLKVCWWLMWYLMILREVQLIVTYSLLQIVPNYQCTVGNFFLIV